MNKNSRSVGPGSPRVWIIAPIPPPYGGMSIQAEKLLRQLRAAGVNAALIPTNPDPPSALRFLSQLPVIRAMIRELQYLISLSRILRDPGIVHHFSASYLFFFLHSAPLVLLRARPGAKLMLNYRGGQAQDFLRQWRWIVVPLMKLADELVVPSAFLQRVFANYGLRSTLVPNIADTEQFCFRQREHFSPRLLVTRNLEPMYDVERVLCAFRTLQMKMPKAKLGIVGAGSEANKLRGLVRNWGMKGVIFYGAVAHENLPAIYRDYDIYINASRVDNFPGAIVEAACSGLPIVTTRAGGISEMIRHRENGLLCDVGDAESLAASALEIVNSPELGCELARSARSWAEQFAWSSVFPKLLRCYGFAETENLSSPSRERVLVQRVQS